MRDRDKRQNGETEAERMRDRDKRQSGETEAERMRDRDKAVRQMQRG